MYNKKQAKSALDALIRKSRVHFYKPIQIAEILYHARMNPNSIDLLKLEDYRKNGVMTLAVYCSEGFALAVRDFKMICLMTMPFLP